MAEQVGAIARNLASQQTGSPPPSERQVAPRSRTIPRPVTPEECRLLKEWAERQPISPLPPATVDELARHLEFMAATLPVGKGMDQDKGRKRFAVYATILGHHSNEALSFMARTACETLDWFPTPRQCIAILKDFRAPRSDRDIALGYCHEFTQARFEAWMESVTAGTATADEIADVPDRWRRIAVERGGLRRLPDGDYIIRKPKADDACAPEDEAI